MRGTPRRIWGLVYRHLCLYRRSWPRIVELAYWPMLGVCIWGFTARYLSHNGQTTGATHVLALTGSMLLAAALLWEVTLRSQMGVAISFLEEVWSRNLGHVFVSPLRPLEMVAGLLLVGLLRVLAGILPTILLAWLLYAFNLFTLGPILVLFFVNLLVMGWATALGVIALLLRHGAGAEAFAWSLIFGFTPLSAVFYPVSALPVWLQPVALAIPASHVFEGMRATMATGQTAWGQMVWAVGLNIVWLIVAAAIFATQFRAARIRGALISIGE